MNSNNDSEISDNFSNFPAEQVATPVPESPDEITEESQEDSTYISITENGDNSGKLKVFTYIYEAVTIIQ